MNNTANWLCTESNYKRFANSRPLHWYINFTTQSRTPQIGILRHFTKSVRVM